MFTSTDAYARERRTTTGFRLCGSASAHQHRPISGTLSTLSIHVSSSDASTPTKCDSHDTDPSTLKLSFLFSFCVAVWSSSSRAAPNSRSFSPPFPCLTVVGRERGAGTSSTQIV